MNIMLDLETLGNKPGAVIVAIGAVEFGGRNLGDSFYTRVSAKSCVESGLTMDVDTVLWWMKQSDDARAELNKPAEHINAALLAFSGWIEAVPIKERVIWGNGSDFDNAILAAAYEKTMISLPWLFWNNRCYRTLKNMRWEIPCVNGGVKHNALDDAKAQAVHLMAMFPEL